MKKERKEELLKERGNLVEDLNQIKNTVALYTIKPSFSNHESLKNSADYVIRLQDYINNRITEIDGELGI